MLRIHGTLDVPGRGKRLNLRLQLCVFALPRCSPSLDRLDGRALRRGKLTATMRPVIAALAQYPVLALTSREPSLEEIFLHHYDSPPGDAAG